MSGTWVALDLILGMIGLSLVVIGVLVLIVTWDWARALGFMGLGALGMFFGTFLPSGGFMALTMFIGGVLCCLSLIAPGGGRRRRKVGRR